MALCGGSGGHSARDVTFRPQSYWDTPQTIFANIKGEQRRRMVQRALEEGDAADLPAWILKDTLTEGERTRTGRIHPFLMGGEYLPDCDDQEIEIARVALRSATGDVISIRARRAEGIIHYSVVDEYDSRFECSPASAAAPLTLEELIDLIETASNESMGYVGLTGTFRDMNIDDDGDPEELVDFVTVSSPFYSQLEEYYAAESQEWLKRVSNRETAREG